MDITNERKDELYRILDNYEEIRKTRALTEEEHEQVRECVFEMLGCRIVITED